MTGVPCSKYFISRLGSYWLPYRPDGPIEFLLIGESPPVSGSYFYISQDLRRRAQSLPAKVFRGLLQTSGGVDQSRHGECLSDLKKLDFFLVDLCQYPVDLFASSYRVKLIRDQLPNFRNLLQSLILSPTAHVVMVLPGATRKELGKRENGDIIANLEQMNIMQEQIIPWSDLENVLAKVRPRLDVDRIPAA